MKNMTLSKQMRELIAFTPHLEKSAKYIYSFKNHRNGDKPFVK